MSEPSPPEPIAYNPLFAIREDTGPFVKMADVFACNKSRWFGPAIASTTAIYLLKKTKNQSGYGGGIAGALLASALAKKDQIATCTVADLPDPVRIQLDKKKKLGAKPVVIIPRSTISLITRKGWSNAINLAVGSDNFSLTLPTFKSKSTLRKFIELGYVLDTPMVPLDAPVHDTRTDEERATPPQTSTAMRILKIAAAIGIILAVIALRLLAGH